MKQDRLNIQAWLDGEIAPKKAAEIAELVKTNAFVRDLAKELKAVESTMKMGEKPIFVDDTREFYWEQIKRQISAEEPMPVAKIEPNLVSDHAGGLMRWLIPVGSLAVIFSIMINFDSINSANPAQSLDEVVAPSIPVLNELGVFNFEGSKEFHNLHTPDDLNPLPESIENPEQ